MRRNVLLFLLSLVAILGLAWRHYLAAEPRLAVARSAPVDQAAAARGYKLLLEKPFLPADLQQSTIDNAWKFWPEPARQQAAEGTAEQRRQLTFARYGLTPRPGDDSGKPLQYVVDGEGNWAMNCFACHGGQVAGRVVPGLPNSHYSLQTMTEETRLYKLAHNLDLTRMDIGSLGMPLGGSRGTTNSVMFGVVLMAFRDADLGIHPNRPVPKMIHHDMDAPPWWHFKRKRMLYIDGFVRKSHRALMPFIMVRQNGPEKFRAWEQDFRDIYAYIESIEAPRYPFAIDRQLAERGEQVFVRSCVECHGTYGDDPTWPERRIPIDRVGTDPVRLTALSREHRVAYRDSWLADYGKSEILINPGGYVAPPLDGIWASAPYLHNGSVPTLWHLLHSDQRPTIWRRTPEGYDQQRVGLEIETFEGSPPATTAREYREYFDTRFRGKSAAGHTFPDALSETEKQALLEYLKTL